MPTNVLLDYSMRRGVNWRQYLGRMTIIKRSLQSVKTLVNTIHHNFFIIELNTHEN